MEYRWDSYRTDACSMPSQLSLPGSLSPEEAVDRVLLERIRLAAKILIMPR